MIRLYLFLATTFFVITSVGQDGTYTTTDGFAIKGYDPVSYFTEGKAIPGVDAYVFEWSGVKWKLSSMANLEKFKQEPLKYAPQFGGYCAYGCSENHKSPTDPNAFTIVNNKLYLNYNTKVKEMWIKDTAIRITNADTYWKSLKQ